MTEMISSWCDTLLNKPDSALPWDHLKSMRYKQSPAILTEFPLSLRPSDAESTYIAGEGMCDYKQSHRYHQVSINSMQQQPLSCQSSTKCGNPSYFYRETLVIILDRRLINKYSVDIGTNTTLWLSVSMLSSK